MTAYNIVNPAALVAGQPEDITQVLANFQAIANVLNGNLDNGNLAAAANIAPSKILLGSSGQILQSLGATVGWGMKITTSPISGGPPAAPSDGDIWIATNADGFGVGTRWNFQYNAGSASAYKWEFIGGSDALTTSSLGAYTAMPVGFSAQAPIFIVPRAGDYDAWGSAQFTTPGADLAQISVGTTSYGPIAQAMSIPAGASLTVSTSEYLNGVANGAQISLWLYAGGVSMQSANRWMRIRPKRVS